MDWTTAIKPAEVLCLQAQFPSRTCKLKGRPLQATYLGDPTRDRGKADIPVASKATNPEATAAKSPDLDTDPQDPRNLRAARPKLLNKVLPCTLCSGSESQSCTWEVRHVGPRIDYGIVVKVASALQAWALSMLTEVGRSHIPSQPGPTKKSVKTFAPYKNSPCALPVAPSINRFRG